MRNDHLAPALARVSILTALLLLSASAALSQSKKSDKHTSEAAADPYAARVKRTSFVSPSGERVLRHEVIVSATLQEAWDSMTTSEGLMSFMAPVVRVELKTGGLFQSSYKVGSKLGDPGTITNHVLSYVPLEMFSIKVNLTDQFPAEPREAGTLFSVLTFQKTDDRHVKVAEAMVGWKQGPDWDKVYGFFDWGNSYTLGQLCKRFEEGPVDWSKKK
jgi:hypothetical protein